MKTNTELQKGLVKVFDDLIKQKKINRIINIGNFWHTIVGLEIIIQPLDFE